MSKTRNPTVSQPNIINEEQKSIDEKAFYNLTK